MSLMFTHSICRSVQSISQSIGCLGKRVSVQNNGADTALSVAPTRKTHLLVSFVHSLTHSLNLPVSPLNLPWGLVFGGLGIDTKQHCPSPKTPSSSPHSLTHLLTQSHAYQSSGPSGVWGTGYQYKKSVAETALSVSWFGLAVRR